MGNLLYLPNSSLGAHMLLPLNIKRESCTFLFGCKQRFSEILAAYTPSTCCNIWTHLQFCSNDRKNINMEPLSLGSGGCCHTLLCHPKLRLTVNNAFDLSSEHFKSSEFLEQSSLRGLLRGCFLLTVASSWTAWPKMKSGSQISHCLGWNALSCWTWKVTSASLFTQEQCVLLTESQHGSSSYSLWDFHF